MIHTQEYYHLVPKEFVANLKFRKEMIKMGSSSKVNAEELWIMCSRDILFYINTFCYIFEPRSKKQLPFITYPFQDHTLHQLIKYGGKEDLVIEKSRDMGASWMCVLATEWQWHFHDLFTALMLSRKADLVDSRGKDPKSLFAKMDFVHNRQPGWLKPSMLRLNMNLSNHWTEGSVDGESTNEFASIADRRFWLLLDEYSKMKNQDVIHAGTRDVCDGRIFNFTPQGSANMAYKIAHDANKRKITLHWSKHPIKSKGLYRVDDGFVTILDEEWHYKNPNYKFVEQDPYNPRFKFRSPWYDIQCKRADNQREIAQELDIDYIGSEYQYFDPSRLATSIKTTSHPWKQIDLTYTPNGDIERVEEVPESWLKIWCAVDRFGKPPSSRYTVGVDVSAGTGATNTVATVIDMRSCQQVAEWATPNMVPHEAGVFCVALAKWFSHKAGEGAYLIWEAPGPGREFGNAVLECGYDNIYYKRVEKDIRKKTSRIPGWWPTKDDKREILSNYRHALAQNQLRIMSLEQLEECRNFIYTKEGWIEHSGQSNTLDTSGAKDNHGDRPTSGALAWHGVKIFGFDNTAITAIKDDPNIVNPLMLDDPPEGSIMWRRKFHEEQKSVINNW